MQVGPNIYINKKNKKKLVRVVIFSLNDENIEMRFEKFTYQINKINKLLYVLINTRESLKINKN
jgi:hypothetical protein